MPLYEFENTEHGIRVTLPFPVAERPEQIVLTRRTVPTRVTVGVGAKPPTDGDKLLQSYKQLEDTGRLKNETGRDYLPIETIKRVCAEPDHEPCLSQ